MLADVAPDSTVAPAGDLRTSTVGHPLLGENQALEIARRVRTGSIDVNGGRYNPLARFGGYKRSGVGREMGIAGLEEFLEVTAIQV